MDEIKGTVCEPLDALLSPSRLDSGSLPEVAFNLATIFRDVAVRHRERPAVADATLTLRYADLWNFAAGYRERLLALGVRPGDPVCLVADRSVPAVAAIVGIVLAGAVYVPVEPESLSGSLADLLTKKGIPFCIAASDTLRRMPELMAGCVVLPLESVPVPLPGPPISIDLPQIGPEQPVYVMFTSGTTGQPKGVVVPHRAVARLVAGQTYLDFGPEHTFLLHSPLAFDASTLELWGSLLTGGLLVVAPAGTLGLADYGRLLETHKITTLWMTAAVFHLAAEHAPQMFAGLRQLIFGGDVIHPQAVERVRRLFPALRMVNGYGPTENTTFTCCYVVPETYVADGPLPIGMPLAGTTVEILDTAGAPVAAGEAGELVTGGLGVALGYWKDEAATAEKFLPDPQAAWPEARRYRTGDRVRQRPDGLVEFLGRIDSEAKIDGRRVDLAEVERVLRACPGVQECAVLVVAPPAGGKRLVAFAAVPEKSPNAEARLRSWLAERVIPAAVPQQITVLERLPVNRNGKVDRAALAALSQVTFSAPLAVTDVTPEIPGTSRPATPQAALEHELCRDWSSLLGREGLNADSNFFELGGTSLLLIELHARLAARHRNMPSLAEMFDLPTPRLLAARLLQPREDSRPMLLARDRGERQRMALAARRGLTNSAPAAVEEKSR